MATKTYRVRIDVRGFVDVLTEADSPKAAEKAARARLAAGEFSPVESPVRITSMGKAVTS